MPSHLPSSFASAAAGQSSRDTRPSGRNEPRGGGDWARKEARSLNGTLTLRRSSTNPNAVPGQAVPQVEQSTTSSASDSFFTQYTNNPGSEAPVDTRYSKDAILDIYKAHQSSVSSNDDVARLFVNNWNPEQQNSSGARGWGKSNDTRDHNHGPEICWDQSGEVQPIGLQDMSDVERSIFTNDVNSPLKPLSQNTKEQGTPGGATNGRKTSVSHGQGGAAGPFGVTPPTPGRPGTRRRETGESVGYSSLTSPATMSRFNRDEPSPFFNRKAGDKDSFLADDRDDGVKHGQTSLPFGGVSRSNTAGSGLGNGPASPWGAPTSATPGEKRPAFGRGESRLAHLMPKESSEELSSKGESLRSDAAKSWRARARTDTDPFDDESIRPGSAALGGQDISPPLSQNRRAPGLDTPSRQASGDLGMSDAPGFRDGMHGHGIHTPHERLGGHRGLESPTETNPYASPPDERAQREEDEASIGSNPMHQARPHGLGGVGEQASNPFGGLARGFPNAPFDGSDRSQTSSATGSKGFPSLGAGGLGGLGGWPTSANPIGTPDRERSFQGAFGNSIFGPMGDMQSPSLGGLGNLGPASGGLSGSNTIGRGSKLGSLFPAAMQAQMHTTETDHQGEDQRQMSNFGAIGRNAFGPPRETDSPLRSGRGVFDDLFQASDFRQGQHPPTEGAQPQTASGSQPPSTSQTPGQAYQQGQTSAEQTPTPGNLPQTQQRTMVMPDRMRWVYLDPQGQTQGPWSGLEMHDWYKASFFTPDLSVKKLEDVEFEPLGQLIRRIGNSREPFLVPQIGIPYGPVTAQSGAPFAPTATTGAPGPQPGAVQPPFAGAFPSFGTTLTAEQQNNLERRKQEEQYLMARQREFLAQQQVNMKQMQMPGGLPSALHHHSSAHSLQSQPSFGSITSPIGPIMPQQQIPTSGSSFFDASARPAPTTGSNLPPDFFREDEVARLSLQDRQQTFGAPTGAAQASRSQLPAIFSQQSQAQAAASQHQAHSENDPQGFRARLQEFEQLRAQHDMEQAEDAPAPATTEPIRPPQNRQQSRTETVTAETEVFVERKDQEEVLSLTEQIQKAASAKQTPQPESPWAKVSSGLPMPFPPPPQSTTPLPAPAAQRGRSNLPETLHAGTRSRSETPDAATAPPSIAPWAKEPVDAPKGPSLKEIQEAEAKKAAKLEESAAAARRALLEQELRAQPAAVAHGLPTTSTWASSASPVGPAVTATSTWSKATTTKVQNPVPTATASKKTLADIQREEELRKQKLAAAAVAAAPALPSGGKRYAELASKPTAGQPAMNSAWSTVGAGGKVKMPGGPIVAAPSPVLRPASSTAGPTLAKVARPAVIENRANTSSAALSSQGGVSTAQQEFTKWANAALAKGLNTDINVDNFVQMLCEFPGEPGVIADSVYANSQLMDGRRVADEFLRRKKQAEKGIVERDGAGSTGFSTAGSGSASAGGWSEVAKKGPAKVEEPVASGFKVVPNKKKGRRNPSIDLNRRPQPPRPLHPPIPLPRHLVRDPPARRRRGVVTSGSSKLNGKRVILTPAHGWESQVSGPETFIGSGGYTRDGGGTRTGASKRREGRGTALTGLTAWRALVTKSGEAIQGRNILVTGIGGGVALNALQFAVAKGCNVWGGVVVSYGMTLGPKIDFPMSAVLKNIDLKGSTMGSRVEFREMVQFVNEKKIVPVVSRVVNGLDNLEGVEGLFQEMKHGKQFGKLIIRIKKDTGSKL
ncbi:hypothetical protein VE04_04969 [Pseudogymnoascus sp. 24MN13]|nr:hypothetical protein VE04_04969 [Pseudogymnoascus sp. 24MN13]